MRIYRAHFGNKLRAARDSAGLTQAQLAELVDVEPPTVSRWESGKDFADDKKIPLIIKALGTDPSYFEITNADIKQMGLKDAAEFLVAFSRQTVLKRAVVRAIVYENPDLIAQTGLHPKAENSLRHIIRQILQDG